MGVRYVVADVAPDTGSTVLRWLGAGGFRKFKIFLAPSTTFKLLPLPPAACDVQPCLRLPCAVGPCCGGR